MGKYRPKYGKSAKSTIWKLVLILLFLDILLLPILVQSRLFGQDPRQQLSSPLPATEEALAFAQSTPQETTAATQPPTLPEVHTAPTEPVHEPETTAPTEHPLPAAAGEAAIPPAETELPPAETELPPPTEMEQASPSEPEATEHVHSFLPSFTVPPDCADAGYTLYECICGLVCTEDPVEPLGHLYEATVVPPTHTAEGYTQYTCSRCGNSYRDDILPPLPTEHIHHFELVQTVEPNCVMVGYSLYRCSCGEAEQQDIVPALGHHFESTVVPPENGEPGYTIFECSRCHIHYRTYY